MFDTNVLISMVLFPNARFTLLMDGITRDHTLVLSSFVIDELMAVADKKFPKKKDAINQYLLKINYEFVYTPHIIQGGLFVIRDRKDYPVLYSEILRTSMY